MHLSAHFTDHVSRVLVAITPMLPVNSALVCAVNSTRGEQSLGDMKMKQLSAFLSGAGFVSRNSADVSRKIGSANRLARGICPITSNARL
jgi:hypothetical protein